MADFEVVELTDRMTEPAVVAVWSLASPDPSDLKHQKRVLDCYPPSGTRRMFGVERDGVVIATCGAQDKGGGNFTVHQMATRPEYRRQGVGRALVKSVFERLNVLVAQCGTDAPNDVFYRRCGFEIVSEGFPPSGVERFKCRWVCRGSGAERVTGG